MSRFREDENELPYLVSQKRDDGTSRDSESYGSEIHFEDDFSSDKNLTNAERLDRILNSMGLFLAQKVILKNALVALLNSRDCTALDVIEKGYGYYAFVFTRENEYIKTTDEFDYTCEFDVRRTFIDCYTSHNYDRLIADSRFWNLVEKTEGEFIRCSGGYETDYSMASDVFSFSDEINLRVIFRVGSCERSYRLDLDRMELSDDYYKL